MPKNIKGGNRAKKNKNHKIAQKLLLKRDIPDTDYGMIVNILGNNRCEVKILSTNIILQGVIRGSIRKQRFFKNDIVLIGYRTYNISSNNNIIDIIHKYNPDHVHQLFNRNEINKNVCTDDIIFSNNDANNDVQFDENEEVDENEEEIDENELYVTDVDDIMEGVEINTNRPTILQKPIITQTKITSVEDLNIIDDIDNI